MTKKQKDGVVGKKEEMRFCIRFNSADPRHRIAAEILNKVGRSKAIIVANALWEYALRYKMLDDASDNLPHDYLIMPSIINHEAITLTESIIHNRHDPNIGHSSNELEDTVLQDAILNGLNLFRDDG